MDRTVFDRMADNDTTHWWYRGRRAVLDTVIKRQLSLPTTARILEVGCGTGHNLAMLTQHGTVEGVEMDTPARALASKRLGRPIIDAKLPDLESVTRNQYDMVGLFDVLEHVDDDVAALKGIADCLAPNGKLLLTVPAFPFLWSAHDVVHHHHRRYTKKELRAVVKAAGLRLDTVSWFNSILFAPIVVARLRDKLMRKPASPDQQPGRYVNRLLEWIFSLERHSVGRLPMPPGISLIAVVSRG